MLVIRKSQMDGFKESTKETLKDRLCALMEKTYHEEAQRIGADGVRRRVNKGVRQATKYSIEDQNNITRYIHLMFLFKTDELDASTATEWAARILGWDQADEHMKMAALEKRAQRELYE